ncbi:hypothetical protein QQM39_27965 [Streptomyces sp. DT2A-34]|nr:hypothetical protein [Streptomyces sp. DT2A-34]MDO0914529.1 hypothetical protein [Streptomyces sp. DT2A-34]
MGNAGSSADGLDSEYGASGWAVTNFPLLMGSGTEVIAPASSWKTRIAIG